ncbi:lipase [Lizonia empirigonia]|nr:lipase [Lizonia empirigonia]
MSNESKPYPYPYSQAAQLDSRITVPRPVIDPAIGPLIDTVSDDAFVTNADKILEAEPFRTHTEHSITVRLPLYLIHGGGMVSGDRFGEVPSVLALLEDIDCILVSVEYRLAPETRAPGPAEDCFTGLVWLSGNASSLGIDPAGIVVCGISGGAALAAAVCLMARDRTSPTVPIKAQMLLSPMLDDRCESVSDRQFEYGVPWNGVTNRSAWSHVLGDACGTDKVTAYQAPSRAVNLSNLPPTYIDVAECEVFRDPAVTYAMNMWRSASTCELHVWPGAVHLFDAIDNPDVPLIGAAISAKRAWLKKVMLPHRS